VKRAVALRQGLNLEGTTAYRLINGEGDFLPGLVCDVYGSTALTTSGSTAVVQFDGRGPSEFYNKEQIAGWISQFTGVKSVVEKFRRNTEGGLNLLAGSPTASVIEITENGVRFEVDIENGQKTGFFLDQRDNRQYVRTISSGKSVLNLFSYTGGFSVYAGLGGATRVASLDVAEGAVRSAEANWALNGLTPAHHEGLAVDVFALPHECHRKMGSRDRRPAFNGPQRRAKRTCSEKIHRPLCRFGEARETRRPTVAQLML
jgi:23S rRNA (cytosine1962-C5)-methyltransferase